MRTQIEPPLRGSPSFRDTSLTGDAAMTTTENRATQHNRRVPPPQWTCGRIHVGPNRILWCVPPPYLKPACQRLRRALEPHLPSLTLDHCWVPGRRQQAAIDLAAASGWTEYLDVVSFFTSVDQRRLWRVLARLDPALLRRVQKMFDLLGCDSGLPEGCPFSPVLANLYVLELDTRWQGRAVRIGDNFATCAATKLANELLDIGLRSQRRSTFVGPET